MLHSLNSVCVMKSVDMEQSSRGKIPLRLLPYSRRFVSNVNRLKVEGTEPVNRLLNIVIDANLLRLPKDGGRVPLNELVSRLMRVSLVREPIEDGIVPVKRRLYISRRTNGTREPSEDGNGPVNSFQCI